jgi:hypothetical protein
VFLLAAANSPASAQHHRHYQVQRPRIIDAVTCDSNGRCIAQAPARAQHFAAYRHRRAARAPVVRRLAPLVSLDANGNGIVRSHKTGARIAALCVEVSGLRR